MEVSKMERKPQYKKKPNENNKYFFDLNGMLQEKVTVRTVDGETIEGIFRGFYIQNHNLSIQTKDDTVIVRNWILMKKKNDT